MGTLLHYVPRCSSPRDCLSRAALSVVLLQTARPEGESCCGTWGAAHPRLQGQKGMSQRGKEGEGSGL